MQEEPVRAEGPDTVAFEQTFARFFEALQAADTAALNGFVSAEHGLWLIEQPGALPSYTHFANIQAVQREYGQRPFTSLAQEVQKCKLKQREQLPGFNCANMEGGATGFAEDGCFYTTDTEEFQNTEMWQYANLTDAQTARIQELQQQVLVTVLHTASSYRFHFGYRNGRWQLLFADLRIPCSA